MKTVLFIVSLLCFVAPAAFAQDRQGLLECTGLGEGDTVSIRVDQNGGALTLTETMADGSSTTDNLPADAWTKKEFDISPIYVVYGRTVKLDEANNWIIQFTCGETRPLTCTTPVQ